MSDSRFLGELVNEQRWDDVGRLGNSHLIRISFEDPTAWPGAFAALPQNWLLQNPRHIFLRSIVESLDKPFTVLAHGDYEVYVEWLDRQEQPLARDVLGRHLGRLQFARALGQHADADSAVEGIHRTIREATEYTDFEDILPSVYIPVGATKLLIGDVESAISTFTEAIRWCAIAGNHPVEPYARNYLALAYALNGELVHALETATAAVGVRSGAPGSFAHVYESAGLLVPPLLALGALDEEASARALAVIDRPVDETEFWSVIAHARARHALYWGDRVAAAETLERLLVTQRALSGTGSLAGAIVRADLADLYQSLGALDASERALDGLGLDLTDRLGATDAPERVHPMILTSRLRLHALRGDHRAVLDGIRDLVENDAPGSPIQAAWAVMRANAAEAEGDEAAVEEYSEQAVAAIVSRGAYDALTEASPVVLSRLIAILGDERRPARLLYRAPEAVQTLTRRESQLLRVLQRDLTLKEIAADLYLSPNTVKTHVRHLYRKLGVQSRDEAVHAGRSLNLGR